LAKRRLLVVGSQGGAGRWHAGTADPAPRYLQRHAGSHGALMTELSPVGWLADQRLLWAALAFGSWLLLCWMCLVRPPRPKAMSSVTASDWLIAYASQ